jgi:eukaryotic-like serine/threonine-protein kinase
VVEPGRRCLGDRYELHQLIAAGGMGQVWRGTDTALHRPVAVKVLRSEYTGDPTFLARFRAEAQHAASLSHPNIAVVFDYGEEIAQDGTGETLAYLVMELVEGEPLSTLVAREGPLSTEATLSLLRQTAFGLGEAHQAGLVHRDVKPGNILVRPDGGVKITDFGIAWSARSVALTRTGQVIGTPQYLSPEQAEGRPTTPASDVYALGLIGYECLTGHPAFDGDNAVTIALKQVRQEPEPLPDDLPVGVRGLIRRALLKDPAARLADGAAFVAAIDDVLAGRPLAEVPATVAVPPAATGEMPRPRVAGDVRSGGVRSGAVTSGAVRSPATRVRSRVATVLLPLLALLAGAGIAAALLQALSDPQPASTASAAEQRSNGSIVLNADDYIGRPVQEVTERLTALGLDVELREEITEDAVPDRVTGVEPTGTSLAPGDTVIVSYAVAPSHTGHSSGGGSAVRGASVDGDAAPTEQGAPSGRTSTTDSGAPGAALPTGTMEASPTGGSASETTSAPTTPPPSETAPTTSETTTTTTPTESDETDD